MIRIHRLTLLLLLFFIPNPGSTAQQISHGELVEVLGIRSWRVPMPIDESMEWSIEFVDFAPRTFKDRNVGRLNPRKKALVVLRDMGDDTFRFTLKQSRGTGQGDLKISVCPAGDEGCDNSYSIEWYDAPKPYDDGMRFVLADIEPMFGTGKPMKQLILVPTHFRVEDIIREQPLRSESRFLSDDRRLTTACTRPPTRRSSSSAKA